jgi:hypothetical protein
MNTFFLYLSMLRYYVIGVKYKQHLVIAQSNKPLGWLRAHLLSRTE